MERSITMKYNTSISHGIEFNLGNGKYHSLGFSILPDKLSLFINRESLFLHLSQYITFNNLSINLDRKNKLKFNNKLKELFRKKKFLDDTNNGIYLIKQRRHTQRENEGISVYVSSICKTGLNSSFYVNVPDHNRDIHDLKQIFLHRRIGELQSNEDAKRIAYLPPHIFKFNSVKLKNKYENKYKSVVNEDLSADRNKINIFTNKYEKMLINNHPEISKNESVFVGMNKSKLNKPLIESFVKMNVPEIFKLDNIETSLRDKNIYYDKITYGLGNNVSDIFITPNLLIKNGLGNNMHINNEWSLIGHNSKELHYIAACVGLDVDLSSKKMMLNDYTRIKVGNKDFHCSDNPISLGIKEFEIYYDKNAIRSKLANRQLNINNLSFLSDTMNREAELNKYFIGINKGYDKLLSTNNVNFTKPYRKLHVNKDNKFLFRKIPQIYFNYYKSLWKPIIETKIDDTNKFLLRIRKDGNVYDKMVNLKYAHIRPGYLEQIINMSLYNKEINLNDTGMLLNQDNSKINIEKIFTLYKYGEAIRTNEINIKLDIDKKEIEINDYYKALDKYPKGITEENGLLINKTSKGISINESIFNIGKKAEYLFFTYDDIWINKNAHSLAINYDYTGISKNNHALSVNYDYTWISKNNHPLSVNYDYTWISKNNHPLSMVHDYTWISKKSHALSIVYKDELVSKFSESIQINKDFTSINKYYNEIFSGDYDCINISKSYKKSSINSHNNFLSKRGKKISKSINEILLISKNHKPVYLDYYIAWLKKEAEVTIKDTNKSFQRTRKEVNVYDSIFELDHAYKRPVYISENIDVRLYEKGTNLYVVGSLLNKGYKETQVEDILFNTSKGRKAARTDEININLDIVPKATEINEYYKTLNKYPKGTRINEEYGLFINKAPKGTLINENIFSICKGAKSAFLRYDDIWINKNAHSSSLNYDYTWILKNSHDSFITYDYTWISKNSHDSFMSYDYTWISKNSHDSFINYDYTWISKNSHDSFMTYDYTWISKNSHDSFINYDYTWISKNSHDSFMTYDYTWISKEKHNSSISYENGFTSKYMKDTQINNYILNVEKNSKGIYIDKNLELYYFPNGIRFDDSRTAAQKHIKGIQTQDDFFIRHDNIPAYTVDNGIEVSHDSKETSFEKIKFMDIDSKAMEIFKEITAKEYSKNLFIEKEMSIEEDSQKTWIDNYHKYFDVKKEAGNANIQDIIRLNSIVNGNLDYLGESVSRVNKKETYIPEQSNFIQAMHSDSEPDIDQPIKSGKIDELILPHKDYTYNEFIKNLINDDGTLNMAYVKNYNAETSEYTVSLPIENPITIYADIGRDYIDVDVAILKLVINLIKKVWQDNMYKYISMSAQDSLKHIMMEVDRLLIAHELKNEERKEAVRCMQLFRWYAEMAVLNNCEYILKFDTKKISVDYYNKDLGDFKDIITFDNMEISDNYIIEPIDETKKCSIDFKSNNINPGPPLNLSFTLYNINTSSSISIIDSNNIESTKVYDQGIHKIKMELKNQIRVKYAPSDKYQSISLANVMIDNKSIRGFSVTYKGRFGETNIVMQNLLDSIIVVGEASEEVMKKYKAVGESSEEAMKKYKDKATEELKPALSDVAPVTVAISTMVNYFKLHHENKLKGKRLITKK